MKSSIRTISYLLLLLPQAVIGFYATLASSKWVMPRHVVSVASTSSSTIQDYTVEVVKGGETDPRVLDVAAFRNGMVNPAMMVERAKSKRDAIDTTAAAVDGLKIGLVYVGPLIGLLTYLESKDVTSALSNYAVLGGGIGVLLAANNYLGRGVHVPDIPEATK